MSETKVKEDMKHVYLLSYAITQNERTSTRITGKVFYDMERKQEEPLALYRKAIQLSTGHETPARNSIHPLMELPWSYRADLVMRYIVRLSTEQIADVMQEPYNRMDDILARAEEELRIQLEETTVVESMEKWEKLCDEDKIQDLNKAFHRKVKNKDLHMKVASAIGALITLLGLVIQYNDYTHPEPIHEVIYEEFSEEGYTGVQVGSNEEEQQLNINIVGSTEEYNRLNHQLKRKARKILDAEDYDDYEVVVESVPVERKVTGVDN